MIKAVPFSIHETKAGQVLTMLAEPEHTGSSQAPAAPELSAPMAESPEQLADDLPK